MNLIFKNLIAPVVLAFVLIVPAAADPLEDGLSAYSNGEYATALEILRPLAEAGNAKAQYQLGFSYDSGKGVIQNDAEAIKWFRRAAEQGDVRAQFHLGLSYSAGDRAPQDDIEAFRWYHMAAEQGAAIAQFVVGEKYFQGVGVPKSDAQAVKWWELAALGGYALAQARLGLVFARGEAGLGQDYVIAHSWMSLAAAQGNKNASNNLKVLGTRMSPVDIKKAELFRDALAKSIPNH
ncbi:MAG: tetratricopeptide repeat protein [Hyphomicrobiales bacterium]